MPLFPSPKPTVSYFNDFDFLKDFEKEFLAIAYNDALTSKLDFLIEPTVSPQHIDGFNLKDETSLSECDEEEQNVLYFNNLFPFNVIYPNDLKSDTDNDNDEIDIEQPSGDMSIIPLPNVINVDDDCLYGVSKPHGYDVLTFWTLSSLYFQHSLYDVFTKRIQRIRHRYQYGISWGMDTAYRLLDLTGKKTTILVKYLQSGNFKVLES
ncbi:hypothetical protein Tco_1497714 [Tanacetum coccineum]